MVDIEDLAAATLGYRDAESPVSAGILLPEVGGGRSAVKSRRTKLNGANSVTGSHDDDVSPSPNIPGTQVSIRRLT